MVAQLPDAASALPAALRESDTVHAYLRRATREWHDRVDAAYARFDLATSVGLGAFLRHQGAALLPLEREVEACGAAAFLPDWFPRRRSAAIEADLAHLGAGMPPLRPPPALPSRLHGIGALYVLEGSKLGARVLLRRVEASPDCRVRSATRYLGHANSGGWVGFLSRLNGLSADAETLACLEAGAATAFAIFLPAATARVEQVSHVRARSNLVHSNQT